MLLIEASTFPLPQVPNMCNYGPAFTAGTFLRALKQNTLTRDEFHEFQLT